MRAKLIFNPASGRPELSANQLVEILTQLQKWEILPEVYLVHPDSSLEQVAAYAVQQGIYLIIVCGGDGTVDSVVGALAGTQATLGIIPIGTQNNVALSLGIPSGNIAQAVRILRRGRRLTVDVVHAVCGPVRRWFLEACSVGLMSALYPAADDIQHGNLARIGDLLATLVASTPAEFTLILDGGKEQVTTQAHMVLVSNMPYIGAHLQAAPDISYNDSQLDVFLYSNLGKLDLIGYAVQVASGITADTRIQHYRVRSVEILTDPPMPVMADGFMMGEGAASITMLRHGLKVMAGTEVSPNLVFRSESREETHPDG